MFCVSAEKHSKQTKTENNKKFSFLYLRLFQSLLSLAPCVICGVKLTPVLFMMLYQKHIIDKMEKVFAQFVRYIDVLSTDVS